MRAAGATNKEAESPAALATLGWRLIPAAVMRTRARSRCRPVRGYTRPAGNTTLPRRSGTKTRRGCKTTPVGHKETDGAAGAPSVLAW